MTVSLVDHPGGDLVQQGMLDYASGRVTPCSCLIEIAWTRLQRGGLELPLRRAQLFPQPEHQLYRLLQTEPGDAYSRYNALLRRLISFTHNLDHQRLSPGSPCSRGR